MIGSPTLDQPLVNQTPARGAPEASTEHPGRWLGGLAGGLASLIAAAVFHAIDPESSHGSSLDLTGIALLGIPIGFALGRGLWPSARSGGWAHAMRIGVALAFAAPPLGAVEILGIPAVAPWLASSSSGLPLLLALPIAIPFSYLALVVTVPVGLLWAVLVKVIPAGIPDRLRIPHPLERLGVRHAVIAVATWVIVVQLAR